MTLRELQIYADGWNEREAEKWREQITIAHLTANLSRYPLPEKGKRDPFPSLESLLPKPPAPPLSRKERSKQNAARFLKFADRHNRRQKKKKRNG